ncbi:hypothetical protein GF312_08490 [Candidatus Poribacteria bacterium]|nr:hypothetical protein [Candidatus Poribacteria bacterium]
MKELIRNIRDELVSTTDTVCLQRARLITEAYQMFDSYPVPLKRAKAFNHVLQNMDLDLKSNPIFAGNTSSRPRAWMLIPEHGMNNDTQVVIENECLKGILDGQIPRDILDYWKDRSFGGSSGIGHLAVDFQRVVHCGLEDIIAEIKSYPETNGEESIYRGAMIIGLQAVIDWSERYAEEAQKAAASEENPLIWEAHLRVAEACSRVPAKPAKNLFEALQAMVLVHLVTAIEGHGMSISIGLPDRVLAPFIDDSFDFEYANNLISAFMLKVAGNSFLGRGSKTQATTVGGLNHLGEDQCNQITLAFMEACDDIRIGDPHIFLRWHDDISPKAKEKAVDMLARGVSMPLLINDVPTAQGFINAGCTPEDAWEYCVIGCNELGIPGRSADSSTAVAGTVQYLAMLNDTLLDHPDPDSIQSMDQLLEALEKNMKQRLTRARENGQKHRVRMAENVPTPFTSALMQGCIKNGKDLVLGMKYRLPGVYERGLTNAANALSSIQRVVFKNGSMSMTQLIRAMQDDFNDASVRAKLVSAPRWGNDNNQADQWATILVDMREQVLNSVDEKFNTGPHMVCHVVRSLHHVDGRRIAASPDGRYAWTPVADSIGAQTGTASEGPTGVINSVLKLDAASNYRGGYNLNITLPKSTASPESVMSLVETFFSKGGQEIQINCLDAHVLREAQKNPEEYGDLVVRIAGFSARFVDLSIKEQNELIERADVVN